MNQKTSKLLRKVAVATRANLKQMKKAWRTSTQAKRAIARRTWKAELA